MAKCTIYIKLYTEQLNAWITSTSNCADGLRFTLVSCENIIFYLNGFPANSTTLNLKGQDFVSWFPSWLYLLNWIITETTEGLLLEFPSALFNDMIHRRWILCYVNCSTGCTGPHNICPQTFHILLSSLYILRFKVSWW
jgi:hypothetical protein